MYSEMAIRVYSLKRAGIFKKSADFWDLYRRPEPCPRLDIEPCIQELKEINATPICFFDGQFPHYEQLVRKYDAPYLFVYRGDFSLMRRTRRNVAVIGIQDPTEEIVAREKVLVRWLTDQGFIIVCGLSKGCDAIAHRECIARGGRSVAILSTEFAGIDPENAELADEIAESGGLVVTEYVGEPDTRQEATARIRLSNRIKAMFSPRAILLASYKRGEGDSSARYVMEKSKEYGRENYVVYGKSNEEDPRFGLNRQILQEGGFPLTLDVLKGFLM